MDRSFWLDCIIFHSRQKPQANQFKYNSFQVLWDVQDLNFVDQLKKKSFRSINIRSKNYLDKTDLRSIESKIFDFLNKRFSYIPEKILLQTTPEICGYAFNPINIWYCYKNNKLDAVLCEVNNTFNETHYYWLPTVSLNPSWQTAEKEFHVSPFFEVTGFYRFQFKRSPVGNHVDIQYLNTQNEIQLVTWIKSTFNPIEHFNFMKIIKKYGLFSFLIIIRIHYQALKLFYKKVPFFSKPKKLAHEVTHESTIHRN